MARVELLFFPGCPNVEGAREQLRRAFDTLGIPAEWTEIDVGSTTSPSRARGYGSPSILVDGRDVTGMSPTGGSSCRFYPGSDPHGVPSLDAIVKALCAALALEDPSSYAVRRVWIAASRVGSVSMSCRIS